MGLAVAREVAAPWPTCTAGMATHEPAAQDRRWESEWPSLRRKTVGVWVGYLALCSCKSSMASGVNEANTPVLCGCESYTSVAGVLQVLARTKHVSGGG